MLHDTVAVVQRCSVKNMFLEISQNSQEGTCPRLCFNKVAGLWWLLLRVVIGRNAENN